MRNNAIETKLKKMIKEDRQRELERRAQMAQEDSSDNDEQEDEEHAENEENEGEPPTNNREFEHQLLRMLMQVNTRDYMMQREIEAQQEQEMLEKAIQESLKENPNPDVMNYEQLQELEERIGCVSKGYTDMEISMIPSKICTIAKGDCSICLEPFKQAELLKGLNCGHEFHKDCIDICFKTTKKCPCCMKEHVISS